MPKTAWKVSSDDDAKKGAQFERNIWAAVFHRAWSDLSRPQDRAEALKWFLEDGEKIGSFRFICLVLGFEWETVLKLAERKYNESRMGQAQTS